MRTRITIAELPNACLTDGEAIRNVARPFSSPIGTLHIASLLQKEFPDYEVKLYNGKSFDPEITEYGEIQYGDRILTKLRIGTPFEHANDIINKTDIFCLSNNFTQNAQIIADFAKHAKKINPSIKIIAGGTDVSTRTDFYLKNNIDYVFVGEADKTLPKFLRGEPGYTGEGDRTIRMKTLEDIPNPDDWPLYDYNLVDTSLFRQSSEGSLPTEKKPYQFLVTSQGCHNSCSFCTNPSLRGHGLKTIDKKAPFYRTMSNDYLKKWLENAKDAGIKTIGICDDSVLTRLLLNPDGTVNKEACKEQKPTEYGLKNLEDFINTITDYGFGIEWPNGLQMSFLYDNPDLIKLCLNKNVYRLYWPLEDLSFEEGAKPRWGKLRTWGEELKTIEDVAKYSETHYFTLGVIIGFPDEDEKSLERVLERSKAVKEIFESHGKEAIFRYFLAQPLPGTPNYESMKPYFVYDINKDPELVSFETTIAETEHLSPHDLVRIREDMTKKVNGTDYVKYMLNSGQIYFKSLEKCADEEIFNTLPYVSSIK